MPLAPARGTQLELSASPSVRLPGGARHTLAWRDAALLTWLALAGPTPRHRLGQLLWPDKDDTAARNSLRQRIFNLRRQLGLDLVAGSATLALAPGVAHDLAESDAVLGDQADSIGGEWGIWLTDQRERRVQRMEQALVELADAAEAAHDLADALVHAREWLALRPLSEEAHRRLMRLHYLNGDRAAALLAFDACERVLKEEVGTRPSPQTLELLATIEKGATAPGPAPGAATGRAMPAAVLRPPRLVGREPQWAALGEAWAQGRIVVVTGEAGMGKSRLLADFSAERGDVITVQARPGDERVLYGTLSRLLRQMPAATLKALPMPLRLELARLLPELADPGSAPAPMQSEHDHTRLANALASVLEDASLGASGYVVDDLHFADESSIELLRFAALGARRRWVFATRPAEGTAAAQALLREQREEGEALLLPLPPLELAQVRELLIDLALPGWNADERAPLLLRRTGGNPLFLLETIKAELQGTSNAVAVVRALPIQQIIERRIGQLSTAAVQLARCAAIAGADFSIGLAAHVLGQRTLDLADPWAELEAAQITRDGAFAHDLIRDSAEASVPGPVARQLHAEIAAYLTGQRCPSARIAEHWIAAAQPREALSHLATAADQAAAAFRHREELALLDRWADVAEACGDRAGAFVALGRTVQLWLLIDRGRLDDAFFQRLVGLATTPQDALRAQMRQAEVASAIGPYERAIALGRQLSERAAELGMRPEQVHALQFAARGASFIGDSELAVQLLRAAVPWVNEQGDGETLMNFSNDFGTCLMNATHLDEGEHWQQLSLQMALERGDMVQAAATAANLVATLRASGRCNDALDMLGQAWRHAAASEQLDGNTWNLELAGYALHRDLGRYGEALAAEARTQRAMEQAPMARPVYRMHRIMLLLHLGQSARAGQALADLEADGLAPHLRARFAMLRARHCRMLGQDPAEWARRAMDSRLAVGRLPIEWAAEVEHARLLDPRPGLQACLQLAQRAESRGVFGIRLCALLRGSERALEAGDHEQAASLARQAMAADRRYGVDDQLPAERFVIAAKAMLAVNDGPGAASAVAEGIAWLRRAAADVPEEMRMPLLERVPPNRELRALAARLDMAA